MPDTHFHRPNHFYHYDDFDRTLVAERVEQFRDQVRRRLAGELTEEQFKPLRLTNGLYLQLHAYMLRIAIPYGTLSSRQLRKLADIARKYDRGYGHFTTRQNLQFNWIKLEDAPDALADLAEVDMHAMQTSGNASATSPPTTTPAPPSTRSRTRASGARSSASGRRCIPNSASCRASSRSPSPARPTTAPRCACTTSACACGANEAGEVGFEVIVGGGLGRTPMIGKTMREFLPSDELLAYLEAILRVYNRYGRRDNLYKARIKILVHEIGAEKMREEVEAEYAAIKDGALEAAGRDHRGDRRASSRRRPCRSGRPSSRRSRRLKLEDRDFALWLKSNVAPHRDGGLRASSPPR